MDFVIYNKKLNIEDTYTKPNITLAPFYNLEKQIKFINEEINNLNLTDSSKNEKEENINIKLF